MKQKEKEPLEQNSSMKGLISFVEYMCLVTGHGLLKSNCFTY